MCIVGTALQPIHAPRSDVTPSDTVAALSKFHLLLQVWRIA